MTRVTAFIFFACFAGCSTTDTRSVDVRIDDVVRSAYEDNDFVGSVLVGKNGRVLYSKSFGFADKGRSIPNADTTRFLIGSLSKPISAIVVLQLVDSGLLKPDDRIDQFLEAKQPGIGKLTIHQLLTHTSGISEVISRAPGVSIAQQINSAKLEFEPGTDFKYSNSAYVILAAICEKVTGLSFRELVQTQVFDKVGMKSSGVARQSDFAHLARGYVDATQSAGQTIDYPIENVNGAGSIFSTVKDLFLLDQALRRDYLLSKSMKDIMHQQHVKEKFGYGWFVRERGGVWDVYYHAGNLPGFTSFFSRRLVKDNCIILLSNFDNGELDDIENKIQRILKSVD